MKTKQVAWLQESLIAMSLVSLDQVTKYLAEIFLTANRWEILPNIGFLLAYNDGIAFSIPFSRWPLIILTILFISFLVWYRIKNPQESKMVVLSFLLIFSGGIGNLIDRIRLGEVIDFISVGTFPIFNLADTWISIGVALYILQEIKKSISAKQKRS